MRKNRFDGKVVLVTGGTKGIGKATVKKFLSEGATVIAVYSQDEETAKKLVQELDTKSVSIYKADISNELTVKTMFHKLKQCYGKLDVLVNSAAIIARTDDWTQIEVDEWNRVFTINATGLGIVCKYAVPLLASQKGSIVNISSIYGLFGSQTELAYSLSKSAVINLTEVLAKATAPAIRVNAIIPGNTKTTMTPPNEKVEEIERNTLLKRSALPEEIADAILFLASDESSYITGTSLFVDGGFHLK